MVVESFCGWGDSGQRALATIARALAVRQGIGVSIATSQLYEGLGTIIMRANALSVLARVSEFVAAGEPSAQGHAQSILETTQ